MSAPFEEHELLPRPLHDERARQQFVGAFRGHLASRLMPGNYAVYRARVEPGFEREHGRKPADRHEVRAAMQREPSYQFWSAMQRRSQELMWESVIDPTERLLPELVARAKRLARRAGRTARGSLALDPGCVGPRYHTAADIHLQPGGYHTEFTDDDVAAGAVYDRALNIYSAGGTGPRNEVLGELLLNYCRERYPELQPARLLDMGCAIGNSTLPWARAYPDCEVHAIDVAAPQLRYAHARARALGVGVHFSQQNAERTSFPDGHFDVVVSHIMLHETSRSALANILRECLRLLRPGGLMLHLEIPRGRTPLEKFLYNWETWNNNETFAGYMTDADLAALAQDAGFAPDRVEFVDHVVRRSREQRLYSEEPYWKILVARR